MVVSDITNPFFGDLLREVERRAAEEGYLVIVSDTASSVAAERAIVGHLQSQRVAGLILTTTLRQTDTTEHLQGLQAPLALFDHRLPGVDCDFIGTENALASTMLTEHLIRLGHRRLAVIGGTEGLYTAIERQRGFVETLRAHGLTPDPELMVYGQYDGRRGYEAAMRLITRAENRPTAIVAASNVMAIGALQACNDLNLRCPEEISLAGIDDVPWSSVIKPRITMAIQPVREMGRAACDCRIERILSPTPIASRERIFSPRLEIGTSTAAPPG